MCWKSFVGCDGHTRQPRHSRERDRHSTTSTRATQRPLMGSPACQRCARPALRSAATQLAALARIHHGGTRADSATPRVLTHGLKHQTKGKKATHRRPGDTELARDELERFGQRVLNLHIRNGAGALFLVAHANAVHAIAAVQRLLLDDQLRARGTEQRHQQRDNNQAPHMDALVVASVVTV